MLRAVLNKIKHHANLMLIRLYDKIYHLGLYPRPQKHYDLVIVKFDRIGDFIISLDSLRTFLKIYEGRKILYVCKSYTTEIVKKCGLFTDVLTVGEVDEFLYNNSLRYHIRFTKQFWNICADLVVNPTWSRIDPSDLVVHLIRSPQKYGCCGEGIGSPCCKNKRDDYYTKMIYQPPYDSEFDYAQFFINNTIDPTFKARLPRINIIYKKEDPLIDGEYVLVGISASYDKRIWPMERLSELMDFIPDRYKIVLMGHGEKDVERANRITVLMKSRQRLVDMVNKTNTWDMFNLISNAKFVIGMDSAPVHIAAASRVRSICIAPGAYYKRFVPYPKHIGEIEFHPRTIVTSNQDCFYCAYACNRPERNNLDSLPCLMEISVDKVKLEITKLLKEIC